MLPWAKRTLLALLLTATGLPAAAQEFASSPVMAQPGETGRRITEAGLVGNYFPAQKGSPTILLLGGSEGALGADRRDTAVAMQRAGFTVLQLSYFRAPGQNPRLERLPLDYFADALRWLGRQPEADARRIAIVGISKGAEAALLVGSRRPDIRAVVAVAPSSVAWPGIAWDGGWDSIGAAWSERGEPVPHLDYGNPETITQLADVYLTGLAELAHRPEAAIPVERIQGPVLLLCGEADNLWPSCLMARQIERRAADHGRPPATVLAYDEAGHEIFGLPLSNDAPDFEELAEFGGTAMATNAARADSWPKVIGFLRNALGGGSR
jgi:uncharacterized protein